jgi:hypothetical protein
MCSSFPNSRPRGASRKAWRKHVNEHGPAAGGLLSSLLDQNCDGSVADDVMGMLGRFMGR